MATHHCSKANVQLFQPQLEARAERVPRKCTDSLICSALPSKPQFYCWVSVLEKYFHLNSEKYVHGFLLMAELLVVENRHCHKCQHTNKMWDSSNATKYCKAVEKPGFN